MRKERKKTMGAIGGMALFLMMFVMLFGGDEDVRS
jgi:hypothetical protein